jgi:hypothetical protein
MHPTNIRLVCRLSDSGIAAALPFLLPPGKPLHENHNFFLFSSRKIGVTMTTSSDAIV